MIEEGLVPVVIHVEEPGGRRSVRVGQATVRGTEVVLSLDSLCLQLEGGVALAAAKPEQGSEVPVAHVEHRLSDLEWLAQRSRRTLADPKKARWHEDMRQQLRKIELEIEHLRSRSGAAAQ